MKKRLALPWGLVLALSAPLAALAPAAAVAQEAGCSWDACALRVEGGSLLQGVRGEVRGTVVGLAPDVTILREGPDSAAVYAARFSLARPRSDQWETWGGLGRGIALAAWIHFAMADTGDGWAWTAAVLMPVSQSARAHARRQDVIAERALERAVWWYNRELAGPVAVQPGLTIPALAGRMAPLPAERSLWDLAPLAGGILGGALTNIFADRAGWIVTGVLFGTSVGNGFAERQLQP